MGGSLYNAVEKENYCKLFIQKMTAFTAPIFSPNCCWGRKIKIKSQLSFLTPYPPSSGKVSHLETRKGWLLTVETEANGDSRSTTYVSISSKSSKSIKQKHF
jgi:hypothetical protein